MVESKGNYKFDRAVKGLKTVNNIIIDMLPLVDALEQQYQKKFTCNELLCCGLIYYCIKSLLIRFYSSSYDRIQGFSLIWLFVCNLY